MENINTKQAQEKYRTDRGWSEVEFEEINLNDARVERRLRRVAEDLSGQPEYPINQASQDAAATKAAYRLFDNENVSAEKILTPHLKKTLGRIRKESVVLAIQDTSYFNYTSHKSVEGLGPIGNTNSDQQGLIMHTTFAVTPSGLPVGILSHRCWARNGYCDSANTYATRAINEKESYKWIMALKEVSELALPSSSSLIHVADRECDIYEFLREAQNIGAKYVIRAGYDRALESEEYATIQEQLKVLKPKACIKLEVPTQKRTAKLHLSFAQITLRAPARVAKAGRVGITCWVVHVEERTPPKGCEPLTWTLLTNIEVNSTKHALERIAWYRRRWSIEEFHKILKSGCTVEDCRLQSADKLKRYIALFSVIAWRILWMVHIQRADPKAPASVALTNVEIGTICSLRRFKELGLCKTALTVKQAIIAIASLGGYRNRKNNPQPGATALWRGWQRLSSMTELYESVY